MSFDIEIPDDLPDDVRHALGRAQAFLDAHRDEPADRLATAADLQQVLGIIYDLVDEFALNVDVGILEVLNGEDDDS